MKIIVPTIQKGGNAKTTSAAALAQAANMAHARSYCTFREPLPVSVTIIE